MVGCGTSKFPALSPLSQDVSNIPDYLATEYSALLNPIGAYTSITEYLTRKPVPEYQAVFFFLSSKILF